MNEIEKLLEEKGVRPTAMRYLIYKYLGDQSVAVSLSDIENTFEKAERTTLYRTIKTFGEKGIVHQIEDGSGIAKYALCEPSCNCEIDKDLHLHFRCLHCDETACLTESKIPKITLPDGFIAEDINLTIKGICASCSKS